MEHAETPAAAPTPARGGWRLQAALFSLYLLFALAATYPLVARARDHVYGVGTPPLNVWAMGFVLHQLPRHPTELFDGNAFYPYKGSLAFSEHLFVPALLSAPVALTSGNLVLAHNVVALLSLAGAGVGMYLLARELTGDGAASFAAGLLYAFHTWNVNELVRLQILSNQYFPFLLLALLRFFARPAWRRAAFVGLAYGLQSLSCMYWALYAPVLVVPCALVLQWRARLSPGRLLRLGAGLLPALLLTGLFAIPYLRHSRQLGFERSLPASVGMDRYLDVLPGNLLYARTLGTAAANQDAAHFLGFVSMALGLLGALRGRFRSEHAALRGVLVALLVAGFLLSLGPEIRLGNRVLAPGPYVLLFDAVPGFRSVRYPERFCVFLLLGLAPLVAAGLARLRGVLGRGGLTVLGLVVFIEHLSAPLPLSPLPTGSQIPEVYRWLARQDDVRVVAEVPAARYKMERSDGLPMYFSTVHWKPTPQGFTGYFPPAYNFIRWRLFHFPAPESRRFLERLGVDTVLVGPAAGPAAAWAGPEERWRVEGPFADGHVVLRLHAAAAPLVDPPRPQVGLVEVPREGWDAQASFPEARRAIDGDPGSAWTTGEAPQAKGDFYRIGFGRSVAVARVSLAVLGPSYRFPTRIRLVGETAEGDRIEIPFDETAAYDGLFARLLLAPREASLDMDLEPRPLTGLRIRIASTDPFLMPWALPEIRVFERR